MGDRRDPVIRRVSSGRRWGRTLVFLAALPSAGAAGAQERKLAWLIPELYGRSGLVVDSEAVLPNGQTHSAHFNSAFQTEFSQLNIALVSQLASVPLPSPASGYTYAFDPQAGVFVRSTQSFGPILTDRAETIGHGQWSLGLSYQRFAFDSIEGVDLRALPAVFTHDDPGTGGRDDVVTTVNSLDLRVAQLTAFVTYGVSSRLDVSLALPVVQVDLDVVSDATIRRIGTTAHPLVHFFKSPSGQYGVTRRFAASGSARGVGDVLLRVKATALKRGAGGLAVGADLLLPTGDEENLLGSGTPGVRPFLVLSSVRRVSPHFNLAYLWNGRSILAGNVLNGNEDKLPHQVISSIGVDVGVGRKLTLALDVLGRRLNDSPRLEQVAFHTLDGSSSFPNIRFRRGSQTRLDGSAGVKWNAFGKVLVDVNVLFKLNDAGVRDRVTPLVVIEYSF